MKRYLIIKNRKSVQLYRLITEPQLMYAAGLYIFHPVAIIHNKVSKDYSSDFTPLGIFDVNTDNYYEKIYPS